MQLIKIIFFVLLFLLSFQHLGNCQNEGTNFSLSSKGHFGFIIAHRGNMTHLVKDHTRMVEIAYSKPSYGNKTWQQIYNYPTLGVSLLHGDLGNPEQLGNVTAIIPYINFSLKRGKYFDLNFRVGHGLSYFEKTFNTYENYKNAAISSHINPMANFQLESKWKLSSRIAIENGIALTHFSNGSYKIPNLGLNIVTINTGLTYLIGAQPQIYKKDSIPPFQRKTEISILVGGSLKEITPIGGPKYPAYSLMGSIDRKLNHKTKIGIGLDLFYNTSLLKKFENDGVILNSDADILQPGLNLSYGYTLHRLTILFNMGGYVYSKYKPVGFFYHRLGTRYQVNDHLVLNATLKTHFAVADHFEIGIGYLLKR